MKNFPPPEKYLPKYYYTFIQTYSEYFKIPKGEILIILRYLFEFLIPRNWGLRHNADDPQGL